MKRTTAVRILLGAGIWLAAAMPGSAQQTLGVYGDWTAVVFGSGDKRMCYIGSTPKKQEGKYTVRGETHVLVTHRPNEKVVGEVSVAAGYPYRQGKDATIEIDKKATFNLFTRDENAWAFDASADRDLVRAMKAGSQMIVRGTSSRGTLTTDTYSLSGFTAAYNAIDKACGL
ncbi:MAG: invasion associated locus B family protein [Rhodospirillales bacterium]|nr:invasion associated locus B family protein [Rhodospirillales bacterium]